MPAIDLLPLAPGLIAVTGDEGTGKTSLLRRLGEDPRTPALWLKGHRTVTMRSSANLVRVIISGGFAPTTAGNPRPFGMPPFGQSLSETEIAAVASYVRSAWGHDAGAVQPLDVQRVR